MLKTLKRIVQEVTTASHLSEALSLLVQHVRQATAVDAVSVFLLDSKHGEYVLIATDGLNKLAESEVRIPLDHGIIGLIGRREEPLNTDNAIMHPNFYPVPLLPEAHLHGFLGVPIIQHRKLYGVLTAQKTDETYFDDAQEAFLITLAAQLGGLIAHAEATGELATLTLPKTQRTSKSDTTQLNLSGLASVPGVAIGSLVVVYPAADIDIVTRQYTEHVEEEVASFYRALQSARDNMLRLSKRMVSSVGENEHALFDVYLRILDNDNLGAEVEQEIREEKLSAQSALASVIKRHVFQFENMKDDYLQERAGDLRDIGRRVLAELQMPQQKEIIYPRRTVLVGDEISAAALAEVPEGQLAGIISAKGANNSHVAILARALGVPTVMGVRGLQLEQLSRRAVIVDGYHGHVYISPP
ncbi:MAG: phosphoenolpyruvate-utilizing N-terminal domain-containing protein, partial [Legionellaceae bacterium]